MNRTPSRQMNYQFLPSLGRSTHPTKSGLPCPRDFLLRRLEHLVAAPGRELAAGRKPDTARIFHMADDRAQCLGTAGPSRNVRMELERAVGRPVWRLLVELVEHSLPHDQRILRIAGVVVGMLIGAAVTEWLSRQLDQHFATRLPQKRQIVRERIVVPKK